MQDRQGRRRAGVVIAFAAAVLLGACGGSGVSGGADGSSSAAPSATTAAVATRTPLPTPGRTVAPTALPAGVLADISFSSSGFGGVATSAAATGLGSVWVETHRSTKLFRVDPETDTVLATIDVGQESCGEPEIGFGKVWLGPCDTSTKTIAVDASTNQVAGSFDAFGGSEVFTSDAVWIPDSLGRLMKVDPTNFQVVAIDDVAPGTQVAWVVLVDGFIWAATQDQVTGIWGGGLIKVDPSDGSVVSRLTVPDPGAYAAVSADFGYIWIKGDDSGKLLRVDPKTSTIKTFDLPGFTGLSQLFDIYPATGLGSVWVRLSNAAVSRVDPETGKVLGTYPALEGGGGGWPTVGFGSLWVPNFGADSIWRDRVAP